MDSRLNRVARISKRHVRAPPTALRHDTRLASLRDMRAGELGLELADNPREM
jgi:hypothetical protein